VRTEEWFEALSPLSGEALAMGPESAQEYRTQHDLFRIGAGVTCSLTIAVFLWAVANLPVRDAVAGAHLPWLGSPAIAAPAITAAAPRGASQITTASPAPAVSVSPTAIPSVAPAAIPTAIPTTAPKTLSPAATPSEPADHKDSTYAVQAGDTLFSIARRHGVTVQALASLNNISDAGLVKVGEQLKVPLA